MGFFKKSHDTSFVSWNSGALYILEIKEVIMVNYNICPEARGLVASPPVAIQTDEQYILWLSSSGGMGVREKIVDYVIKQQKYTEWKAIQSKANGRAIVVTIVLKGQTPPTQLKMEKIGQVLNVKIGSRIADWAACKVIP